MQSKCENVKSVIDLGTNTCLLLVASVNNKSLNVLLEAQKIPRIGKNLYRSGLISSESFNEAADIFREYISMSNALNASEIHAFGTSALRDAFNGKDFIEFIKTNTGIEIKIISGIKEAQYAFEGALFDIGNPDDYSVLDIGGGSSELSFMCEEKITSFSFLLGSVRLKEMFFEHDNSRANFDQAAEYIGKILRDTDFKITENKKLAGVAGTITTLSAIKNKLTNFDAKIIHKDIIAFDEVIQLFDLLARMTIEERMNLGSYMKGRGDIILPGVLILREIMKYYNYKDITVSVKGLRYGLMLNLTDFKN
ncbi:MAG: Exopolyphosphatase 2 [Ignavibacteria bacterium]|nr:Exopolyphosphatase 2 [Ignavibacteria bacterium]